jgi:hypothetical protein
MNGEIPMQRGLEDRPELGRDDRDDWTAHRIAALVCVERGDGRKSHVFLDHSNKCQCGEVDLNKYRSMVLR